MVEGGGGPAVFCLLLYFSSTSEEQNMFDGLFVLQILVRLKETRAACFSLKDQ